MRINTQFAVSVHILTLLAYFEHEDITSDIMARSVGTNPVVVRRHIQLLKKAGLVTVCPGAKGTKLCKPAAEITLLDIYNAVRSPEDHVFDLHPNPYEHCVIGLHIKDAISSPIASAQEALENNLASHTLHDIVKSIAKKSGKRYR